MPIYEYQCQLCEHELEVLQKISDPLLSDCPACGKASLVKRISAPSFRLKGGGWYETDFKTGNKRNLAGDAKAADAGSSSDGKTGDAKSGDSKGAGGKGADSKPSKADNSGSGVGNAGANAGGKTKSAAKGAGGAAD